MSQKIDQRINLYIAALKSGDIQKIVHRRQEAMATYQDSISTRIEESMEDFALYLDQLGYEVDDK